MKTKNIIIVVVTLFVLALIGGGIYAIAWIVKPTNTFTIQESVEKTIVPTEAKARFGVVTRNDDQKIANQENEKKVSEVTNKLLSDYKIPKNQIKTTKSSNKEPIYSPNPVSSSEKPKERFVTTTSYEITVKDLEKNKDLGSIVDLFGGEDIASDSTGTYIDNYSFGEYKIPDSSKICDELETQLIQKLKSSLDSKLSVYGGKSISQAFNINKEMCKNVSNGYYPPVYKLNEARATSVGVAENDDGSEVLAGEQKLTMSGQLIVITK
jgi:Protein of unknown function (DUF541)